MTMEIVSFPNTNGDFPWLCKRLPEGTSGVFGAREARYNSQIPTPW